MTELFPHFQVIVVSGLHDSGPGHWQRLHPEFVRVRQDDFEQPDLAAWAARLPALSLDCPSILVSSANDPWMSAPHAALWARRGGSELIEEGRLGHINAESGLGDWPSGYNYL